MSRRAVLFLALAFPLFAHAQILISRIEVRGDVPASIVISQSALVEGRSYRESDLEAGVARVRRLPFVYDARYVVDGDTLRIDVTGMTRLFGQLELIGARSEFDQDSATFLGIGARHFLGSGVLEGRLNSVLGEGDTLRYGLGYSHYGIAGTRLFATVSADAPFNETEGFQSDPAGQLVLGYPLTVRQTVTASAFRSGFSASRSLPGLPRPLVSESESVSLDLRWTYDTTEDPFFARRGTLLSAGPSFRRSESSFENATIPPPPLEPSISTRRSEGDARTLGIEARQFWSLGARSTVFGDVEASHENNEFAERTNDGTPLTSERDSDIVHVSLGVGHNFFDRESPIRDGRHRVELAVTASRRESESATFSRTDDEQSVTLGYLYRRRFATVRVNLLWGFE